jgi:hypothetical protein
VFRKLKLLKVSIFKVEVAKVSIFKVKVTKVQLDVFLMDRRTRHDEGKIRMGRKIKTYERMN